MRTRRQNNQLELTLEPAAKGEARSAGAQGTEARTARAEPERPAAGQQPSMEAVVEPGNLKKALARVRRNKGAPGVDGMTVDKLGDHLKAHWPEIRSRLTGRALSRRLVLAMIKRRAVAAGLPLSTCCHTFRATGITAYLSNGGTLEHAQQIAGHASPKTTKLYDRTADTITVDEIERIVI